MSYIVEKGLKKRFSLAVYVNPRFYPDIGVFLDIYPMQSPYIVQQ